MKEEVNLGEIIIIMLIVIATVGALSWRCLLYGVFVFIGRLYCGFNPHSYLDNRIR